MTIGTVANGSTAVDPNGLRRTFTRFIGGFGASLLGDQIWFLALGIAARPYGAGAVSTVLTAGSVPRAILLLVGGTAVDRLGPLRIALATQRVRIGLMAAVAAVSLVSHRPSLVYLIVLAALFGVSDAAHMPAASALPPQLVLKKDLTSAQGTVQTVERLTTVLGAPLGGLIVSTYGFGAGATVNTMLFVGTYYCFWGLRGSDRVVDNLLTKRASPIADLVAGLKYVATNRVIRTSLLVVTFINLTVAAPLNVGLLAKSNSLHWGAAELGFVFAAFGLGAFGGSLLSIRWKPNRFAGGVGTCWALLAACALAVLGLAPSIAWSMTAASIMGFSCGPAGALLVGLVQARCDPGFMGRVMSLATFSAIGLTPVSYSLFGLLARFGLDQAFVICAGTQVAVCVIALLSTSIRTASLREETASLREEGSHDG